MILITGCAGFIGSNLCESLLYDKQSVFGIDNLDPYYDIRIKKQNLSKLVKFNNFKYLSIDITDKETVAKLFAKYKFTHIVHLAARPGVSTSLKDPFPYINNNIYGTLVLLEQIKRLKTVPFIFGSSSSVYGGEESIPFTENSSTNIQLSPYGASKKAGEIYCRLYHDLYGIPMTILRFFTVYGPRVRPDMAILKFIKAIDKGKEITVYNNGEVERDYTYITDIVCGIKNSIKKKFLYEVINLGNNNPVKLSTIVMLLERNLNKKAKVNSTVLPASEMKKTWANINKAKKLLDWIPKVKIEEGIDNLISWYKQNNNYEQS